MSFRFYCLNLIVNDTTLHFSADSKTDNGVARLTPHTAFVDPTTPKDAPLRQSIELRALVLYVPCCLIYHFIDSDFRSVTMVSPPMLEQD